MGTRDGITGMVDRQTSVGIDLRKRRLLCDVSEGDAEIGFRIALLKLREHRRCLSDVEIQ
jgi:hypothetical protein